MRLRTSILVPLAAVLVFGSCKGQVTEEDIEGWVRSASFNKVAEYIDNPDNPQDLRVRAVELLVEYGQVAPLQAAMEGVKDRAKFVGVVTEKLVSNLKEGPLEVQIQAKNALLAMLSYLDDRSQDEVLKAIADWAFAGLDDDPPKDKLLKRLEETEMSGHLTLMRKHGIKVAAWLLSNGIDTRRLIPYLEEAKDAASQRIVIGAVRKLFAMKNIVIPWELLDAVHTYPLPETVDFLVDVYLNDKFPDEAQSSALAAAQDLLYGRVEGVNLLDTPERRAEVIKSVGRLLASARATDRWDAADMLLHIGGTAELGTILDGFKDNLPSWTRYTPEEEMELPDFVITELCGTQLKPKAAEVRPVLEARLATGDRVQKAFSVLCLKVIGQPASIDKLTPLTGDATSLEDFFFPKEDREARARRIEAKEIPEITLGLLAQNAIDGIGLLGEIEKARAEGKMSEGEAKLRTLSTLSVIGFAGEAFRPAVEQAYQLKKARQDGAQAPGGATPPASP